MTRRILVIGAGAMLAQAVAERLADSGVEVAHAPGRGELHPDVRGLRLSHHAVEAVSKEYGPYNDVAQLKRQVRAREKHMRKLLPKGRK
jgi:NAD(P)-dependent dehydrogenase (short-subunit alcohol dehydrogenase family)